MYDENYMVKFADDTYLIVPTVNNMDHVMLNLHNAHINDWVDKNKLLLNCPKTKEILFRSTNEDVQRKSRRPAKASREFQA